MMIDWSRVEATILRAIWGLSFLERQRRQFGVWAALSSLLLSGAGRWWWRGEKAMRHIRSLQDWIPFRDWDHAFGRI